MSYTVIRPYDVHALGLALGRVVDQEAETRGLGVIFSCQGINTVLRHPSGGSDGYLVIEQTIQRVPPAPWTVTCGPWVATAPKPPPKPVEQASVWQDVSGLGLQLISLGIGIAGLLGGTALDATGEGAVAGVPLQIWSWSQVVVSTGLFVNEAARVWSDIWDNGSLSRAEGRSYTYEIVKDTALAYQLFAPAGWFGLGGKVMKAGALDEAVGEANVSWWQALRGEIGPGARVKLGYALKVGDRAATKDAISSFLLTKGGGLMLLQEFLYVFKSGLNGPLSGPLHWAGQRLDSVNLHFGFLSLFADHGTRTQGAW